MKETESTVWIWKMKCEESRITAKFWAWGTRQIVFPLSTIEERGEGTK